MSRTLKSSGWPSADVMPLVEHFGDLIDRQRDIFGRVGLDHDLVDVDEADRLRACRPSRSVEAAGIERSWRFRIELVERIDRRRCRPLAPWDRCWACWKCRSLD